MAKLFYLPNAIMALENGADYDGEEISEKQKAFFLKNNPKEWFTEERISIHLEYHGYEVKHQPKENAKVVESVEVASIIETAEEENKVTTKSRKPRSKKQATQKLEDKA